MAEESIHIIDPKQESKYHLIEPEGDNDPAPLCDPEMKVEVSTVREKDISSISPENTCVQCINEAQERL